MEKFIPVYEPYKAKNQKKYVLDCLDTNMLTFRGKYVDLFEKKLASYLNTKNVITTFNGSVSLYLMMYSLGIKPNDEVITCSLTYAATVSQLNLLGAIAVFVDSDDNLQMNLSQIERSITKKTRAVLVPELYADAPNMLELVKLCKKHDLLLLEDSAEAFACKSGGKYIGTFGTASSFSFFANKCITGGELGCVCTDDDKLADKMRLFKNQSHIGGFIHNGPGTNFRPTNIQCAIALAQLEDIDIILKEKKRVANYYRKNLDSKIERIMPKLNVSSEWMPVFAFDPEAMTYMKFSGACKEAGIDTRPIFTPMHLMKNFKWKTKVSLENSERVYKNKFNLPSHPDLTNLQLKEIVDIVNKVINGPI